MPDVVLDESEHITATREILDAIAVRAPAVKPLVDEAHAELTLLNGKEWAAIARLGNQDATIADLTARLAACEGTPEPSEFLYQYDF